MSAANGIRHRKHDRCGNRHHADIAYDQRQHNLCDQHQTEQPPVVGQNSAAQTSQPLSAAEAHPYRKNVTENAARSRHNAGILQHREQQAADVVRQIRLENIKQTACDAHCPAHQDNGIGRTRVARTGMLHINAPGFADEIGRIQRTYQITYQNAQYRLQEPASVVSIVCSPIVPQNRQKSHIEIAHNKILYCLKYPWKALPLQKSANRRII